MGTPQLTYGPRGTRYAGQLAYGHRLGYVESRAVETAAGVDFGLVVSEGSTDEGCVLGGLKPVGIAFRDHGQGMDESGEGRYEQKSIASIIDKDFVIVETVSTSGAYRDMVCYNTTTGAIVIGAPSATQKPIGWLAETVTAAGKIKIFVDAKMAFDFVSDATALALVAGDTEIAATWTDPTDADLNHLVVTAAVTSTGLEAARYEVAAAAEALTITGLTNATEYTVTVKAVDTVGNISAGVSDTETPSA